MKTLAALSCLALTVAALALRPETPVTQGEASAVFVKVDKVMKGVLQLKTSSPLFPAGSGTATREQILRQLNAELQIVRTKFKFTPPTSKSAPDVLSLKDAQSRQFALKLETMGFVDRYGPLVTSKSEGLAPEEFGDAIGYFIARVAELTHTPTAKFSPYLMPG